MNWIAKVEYQVKLFSHYRSYEKLSAYIVISGEEPRESPEEEQELFEFWQSVKPEDAAKLLAQFN